MSDERKALRRELELAREKRDAERRQLRFQKLVIACDSKRLLQAAADHARWQMTVDRLAAELRRGA